jgi:hypothetical protein
MENDTNNETIDSTNDTETVDTESTGTETKVDDAQSSNEVDVSKLQSSNKKLYERAKAAEDKLKAIKQLGNSPTPTAKVEQPTASPSIDVDERILKAQGMSDALLQQLKDVATLRKISLIDAQKDVLFVAVKSDYEKKEKSKAASVGASRGSGNIPVQKTLNTAGLTRDEHRALVKGN